MKHFTGLLITVLLVAVDAAVPGYRYQQPSPAPQHPGRNNPIPIGLPAPRPQSQSGIYSVQQAPPLAQFSISAQPAPQQQHSIPLPAPQHHHHPQPAPQQQIQPQPQPAQINFPPLQNSPPVIGLPAPGPAPHEIAIPAEPLQYQPPPQTYIPPPQPQIQIQQQQSHAVQPIPSVPQGHEKQVFQQQLSLPINNGGFQQQNFQFQQPRPQTAIVTKDIYIHSAPEDHDNDDGVPHFESGPVRKNYRIVFIKAPTQNLRSAAAALKRAQSANEEKTIIYVLSKKPDLSEVQQQLQQVQIEQKPNKPEVYFIKYKTQEEAQRAQQEIQAQYDALGGSTHISDEGVAPVTSVSGISSGALNLSGPIGGGSIQQNYQSHSHIHSHAHSHGSHGVSQKYLPPVQKKK